jgi:hypothetical protein
MKKKTDKSESVAFSLGDELIADLRRLIMDARKNALLMVKKMSPHRGDIWDYGNLAEIRLPVVDLKIQHHYAEQHRELLDRISNANAILIQRKREIEKMILGVKSVEDI